MGGTVVPHSIPMPGGPLCGAQPCPTPRGDFGGARAARGWLWLPRGPSVGAAGPDPALEVARPIPAPSLGVWGGGCWTPAPERGAHQQVPDGERAIPGNSRQFPAPSNLRLKSRSRVSMATGPTRRRCCGGPGVGWGRGRWGGGFLCPPSRSPASLASHQHFIRHSASLGNPRWEIHFSEQLS